MAELGDIVLSQGRDLDGSLQVLDSARDGSEAEHERAAAAIKAERVRAGVLVDNAVRERDAAHAKAMAEAEAKAKAALDKVEMAAALERSRSRQLADKNSAEIADLSGEDPDLHFDARRRQGPRQADRAHHPRPAPRHPAPRASVPTSSLLLPSPSSCAPQ